MSDCDGQCVRSEMASMRSELARLFGEVREHHGMTWWACMLARIGEHLADNERLREVLRVVEADVARIVANHDRPPFGYVHVDLPLVKDLGEKARAALAGRTK